MLAALKASWDRGWPCYGPELKLREEVREFVGEWARRGPLWWQVGNQVVPAFYRELARRGWTGLHWPKALGGSGLSRVATALLLEELNYGLAPDGGLIPAVAFLGDLLLACGTAEQQQRWLPRLARGEVVASLGLTEPEAGSDLAAVSTGAQIREEGMVIWGEKIFTGLAHQADVAIVLLRSEAEVEDRHQGLTVCLVDLRQPGVRVDELKTWGGWRQNRVVFQGAQASWDDVVGEVGQGWQVLTTLINLERYAIARIGLIRRLLEETWPEDGHGARDWLRWWQEAEALRLLNYRMAQSWDLGKRVRPFQGSLLKVRAAQLLDEVIDGVRDRFGLMGYAFNRSPEVAQILDAVERNRALFTIGGGVPAVQKDAIARFGLNL